MRAGELHPHKLEYIDIAPPPAVGKPPEVELQPITFTKVELAPRMTIKPLSPEHMEMVRRELGIFIRNRQAARKLGTVYDFVADLPVENEPNVPLPP